MFCTVKKQQKTWLRVLKADAQGARSIFGYQTLDDEVVLSKPSGPRAGPQSLGDCTLFQKRGVCVCVDVCFICLLQHH